MQSLYRPVGDVNREQFVLSIYNQIDAVDRSTPAGKIFSVTNFQNLSFALTVKQPTTASVQTNWYIDSQLVPGASANTFTVISDLLGNGTHTVRSQTNDTTSFVRTDPSLLLCQLSITDFDSDHFRFDHCHCRSACSTQDLSQSYRGNITN